MPQTLAPRSPLVRRRAWSLPARLLLMLALPAAGLNLASAQGASPTPPGSAGGSKTEAAVAPKSEAAKTPKAETATTPKSETAVASKTAPAAPARVPDQVWSTQPSPVPAYISGGGGAAVIVAPVVVPPGGGRPGTAPRPHPGAGAGAERPAGVFRPESGR
jgi:hypothetical protein